MQLHSHSFICQSARCRLQQLLRLRIHLFDRKIFFKFSYFRFKRIVSEILKRNIVAVISRLLRLIRKLGKGGDWELISRAYHMVFAHVMGVQGLFLVVAGQISLPHIIFGIVITYLSAIGIAAGAHRLWSHRSYKAKLQLRIMLMILQTLAGQGSLFYWARDHRLHHKYSETDADPHNISRGIFFTHIGWTMIKEHPEVTEKEKTMDFSDLHNDSVVAFQHKDIGPADVTWPSLLIVGEGWHNFHHVFPWDYRSTDVGLYVCNLATAFIDFMAKIGWAYDLKTVPDHVIRRRAARTGDGSHPHATALLANEEETEDETRHATINNDTNSKTDLNENQAAIDKLDVGDIEPAPWGWGDEYIPKEDAQQTIVIHGKSEQGWELKKS